MIRSSQLTVHDSQRDREREGVIRERERGTQAQGRKGGEERENNKMTVRPATTQISLGIRSV